MINKTQFNDEAKYIDLLSRAVELSRTETEMDENSLVFSQESQDSNSALSLLYRTTQQSIENEQKRYMDLFQTVETIITESSSKTKTFTVPTVEFLHKSFTKWINKGIPIKSPPFKPLCGAVEFPNDRIIPPHSYACVPIESDFFLVYVIGFDPETLCYHCCDADPDPSGNDLHDIVVPIKGIVPLPTSMPSKHLKGTYFPVKTRVLALWSENGQWTSAFYPATVAQVPTTTPGLYRLKFDGQPPLYQNVPEQMVVKNPFD